MYHVFQNMCATTVCCTCLYMCKTTCVHNSLCSACTGEKLITKMFQHCFLSVHFGCSYTRGNNTYLLSLTVLMETHQRSWMIDRNWERGEKNKLEIFCYCTVALLIVPVAFLSGDSKTCHISLSPSVGGEDQSRTQQECAVVLCCWNSRHSSRPLNQHKLHAFVSFRVHLYIFQYFEGIPPCWVFPIWWKLGWHIREPGA